MRYNLSPFDNVFNPDISSHKIIKDRLHTFFNNEKINSSISDQYYDILIEGYQQIPFIINSETLVDEYSGLFTFNTFDMESRHSFNLANFIRRNYLNFANRKIRTLCSDYGLLNMQIKQCGLTLSNVEIPKHSQVGAVLAVVGNDVYPYSLDIQNEYDIIFASNVFEQSDQAWENWNMLFDEHLSGKEVYFSSNTFYHLKGFLNYDRIKQVENPIEIYDKHIYAMEEYGYRHKIYKIV